MKLSGEVLKKENNNKKEGRKKGRKETERKGRMESQPQLEGQILRIMVRPWRASLPKSPSCVIHNCRCSRCFLLEEPHLLQNSCSQGN